MFQKVLILNRGEIACRIARTCKRLGVRVVAVYSDADEKAPHVGLADEAVRLGPAPVRDSYLNLDAVLAALKTTGAEALHPGYGLLSESPALARAVESAGATFIGPSPEALERLGDKLSARALARSVGVEPPPGSAEAIDPEDTARLAAEAERIGLPLIVKAAAGGGGIGMLVVRDAGELARAAKTCTDRARQAFADGRVYLERYLERPRHVEVQIFVDAAGSAVALGERECSVQRRHQKIIEESPCAAGLFAGQPGEARRTALFEKALAVVRAANYRGAGTVEFVIDAQGQPYFLEVNARLQVEHPVTEMVTGLDLVELQLRIAAGEPLPESVRNNRRSGHAIEARLYAEDPARGFLPQPGRLERLAFPQNMPGIRVDTGFVEGGEVTQHYDPLIAKIIAHAETRAEASARLDRALAATEIRLMGPKSVRQTNLELLRRVLASPEFEAGEYDTGLVERLGAPK
ncbi:MAG TPA: biotin carboxylase N-terminal domain-containing protein [Polyangiaceae bacterium]|nr:biotin carboxylase N-terminal domain-containing protein [Polyangiaceae bacterium]